MTKLTALKELAEKVEAGVDFIDAALDQAVASIMPGSEFETDYECAVRIRDAQRGYLDAAKALHEAVLPGWVWGICFDAHSELYAWVGDGEYETDEHYSPNPARAWLAAIIAAKISELESEQ